MQLIDLLPLSLAIAAFALRFLSADTYPEIEVKVQHPKGDRKTADLQPHYA